MSVRRKADSPGKGSRIILIPRHAKSDRVCILRGKFNGIVRVGQVVARVELEDGLARLLQVSSEGTAAQAVFTMLLLALRRGLRSSRMVVAPPILITARFFALNSVFVTGSVTFKLRSDSDMDILARGEAVGSAIACGSDCSIDRSL